MRPWKYYSLRDQYARAARLAAELKPAEEGTDMAKNRLEEIRIRPAKDGSHNVRHEYQPQPKVSKGMAGGMMMDRPEPEEHNFGPKDGKAMMQHLAQALALRGALEGEQEPEPAGLSNAERG